MPPEAPPAASAGLAPPNESGWQEATLSPRPAENGENAALGSSCNADAALSATAERYATAVAHGATPDAAELELWLRMQGSPYVWPRAWARGGIDPAAAPPVDDWLASFAPAGERRCGLGSSRDGTAEVTALVAVDVLADLSPLPARARAGSWLTLEAELLVPASGAKVVVLGPTGLPRPVPTSFDGQRRIRAPFALREPGRFLVQVLAEVRGGPRPVLEALVFADVEPPANPAPERAPGEEAAAGQSDPSAAVFAMLSRLRADQGLPPLSRSAELDAVALAHASAMRDAGRIGHDVGTGGPSERLAAAGLVVSRAGENVAHAATVTLAHRKLHASPSHRANLLGADFDSVGVAAVSDADGLVWVCQVFARAPR